MAVGISDIPAIRAGSLQLYQDASDLMLFGQKIDALNNAGFVQAIMDTTATISLNPSQKQLLLDQYTAMKAKLQADFLQLP